MESGSIWGTWLAYAAIVAFLILLLAVFLRTMAMFATLTFMPVAHVGRWITRVILRRGS